jgi:hypothetical protein
MITNSIQPDLKQGNEPLAPHDIISCFPALEGPDLHALAEDIRRHGLLEPITLYQDKILDGRARYHACREAKVESRFTQYEGNDPLAFVISANLRRRNLNESQRAMIAANIEGFRHGGDRRHSDQDVNLRIDREKAAKLLNVSPRSVASAAIVRDSGIARLTQAVLQGKVAVSSAATFAQQEPREQQHWIEKSINVRSAVRAFRRQRAPEGPYKDLQALIAPTEKLMRHTVTQISSDIPDEQYRSMIAVVKRFKNFFVGLDAEMGTRTGSKDGVPGDDRAQINALIARAKKSTGRRDQSSVMEMVIPQLTPAQRNIFLAGEFGKIAKAAVERANA